MAQPQPEPKSEKALEKYPDLMRSRVLLLFITTVYPTWYFIYNYYDPKARDPLSERSAVGLYALFCFALTFVSARARRHSTLLFVSAAWAVTAHYFINVYLNKMSVMFSVGGFIVVNALSACLVTRRQIISYTLLVLALVALDSTVETTFPKMVFSVGLATVLLMSYLSIDSRFRLFEMIRQGKVELEVLLNNLGQGFLVFDRKATIAPGSTRAATEFFMTDPTGKNLADVLQLDEKGRADLLQWCDFNFTGALSFKDLKPLAPSSFKKQTGRFIELDYRPIYGSANQLEKIILVSSDKTEEKKLQAQVELEQAMVKMLVQITRDRQTFLDFVHETRKVLTALALSFEDSAGSPDLSFVMRALHSVKGNLSVFEMKSLAQLAHTLETDISAYRGRPTPEFDEKRGHFKEKIRDLTAAFERVLDENRSVIGSTDENAPRPRTILTSTVARLIKEAAKESGPRARIVQLLIEELCLEPLRTQFEKYSEVVRGIAERQMKEARFELAASDIRIWLPSYRPLLSACIHIFRNAVDHGIELPFEREEAGKAPHGTVKVEFSSAEGRVVITISDDGHGIDPEIVGKKAVEKDVITSDQRARMKPEEIIQLVFAPGFSTRDEVSELSGRGVGLDAVKTEAEKLGGTVRLTSEIGKGSCFVLDLPLIQGPTASQPKLQAA